MKKKLFTILVVLVMLCMAATANATLRIVALSRSGDIHQTELALGEAALGLAPGDKMMVFAARTRTLIGTTIAIPDDPTKVRRDRKTPYIVPTLAAVKVYLETPSSPGVDESVIDASSFLDEIAATIAEHSSEDVRIEFIGGPWFTTPGALERSDYRQTWPSDGSILGDRSHSPLGTLGLHDLGGASIDYCVTTGPTTFLTTEQRDRFERAWGLIISARGGQLTSFMTDLKNCYDRFAQAKAPDAKTYVFDGDDAKVVAMYKAKDPAPDIRDAPAVKTAQPLPSSASTRQEEAARFTQTARTTPPSTLTGPAWVGIQWHEPVDLDLYVRCSPNAPFLFFGNQRSFEGRHNYDYRIGTGTSFETVDLTQPCPDISKTQILVNFYEGRVSAPINGVIAIQFGGSIYKSNFTMPATYGNGGRGLSSAGDPSSSFWVRIDPASVLHLNEQHRAAR